MRSTFSTMHSRVAHCSPLAVVDRAEIRRSCSIRGQNDVKGQLERSTPTRRGLCPPYVLSQRLIGVSDGRQGSSCKLAGEVSLHRERTALLYNDLDAGNP